MNKNAINRNNRLKVEAIAQKFRDVLQWEEYASKYFDQKIPFAPFASLSIFASLDSWCLENDPNAPRITPKGYDLLDVHWIPTYRLEKPTDNQTIACMEYNENYATTWDLSLVAIQFDTQQLTVWNPKENVWAKFVVGANVSEAFASFLHTWFI